MRMMSLCIRIIRQFLHDKRTLALLILAPILVLTLLYLVFNGEDYTPKIGTAGLPAPVEQRLAEGKAGITSFSSLQDAVEALKAGSIDAYVFIEEGKPIVKLEGSDPSKSKAVLLFIGNTLGHTAEPTGSGASESPLPEPGNLPQPIVQYLHGGPDMTTFDNLGSVFIGVFTFFYVFLIAGVSFLKERTSGTLERLLATPLRRHEIVIGYMLGFGLFTGIQSLVIAAFSIHVLGLMLVGSIWYVLLITVLISATALSFGMLLSSFAGSEFQLMQFIPLVIVPQVFFSGLFNLESMSPWISWLSHIMPLAYGADALKSIMIKGEGWSSIAFDVYVLAGFCMVFMSANIIALRKHRAL